jgi:hypothetical protein
MTVTWMVCGIGTHTSMPVSVKVTGGPIRVGVSTSESFTSPTWSGSTAVDGTGQAKVLLTGLTPGTRYWWRVEDGGTVDNAVTGTFLTDSAPAGSPMSYTTLCIGDAGATPLTPGVAGSAVPNRISNHGIFSYLRDRMVAEDWLLDVHHGDWCYYDLGSGNHGLSATASLAQYQAMWDDVMRQPNQHLLYRSGQHGFEPDDHDYGPNNSDSTAPGKLNFLSMYRSRMPTPTLPLGTGLPVCYSFQKGRVLHIMSETRSARVPGSTMLGSDQLAWLEDQLATSDAEALIWHMPTPWLGLSSDTWAGFTSERSTIVGWLQSYGWTDRMWMINADAHCLTMTSPQGNPHGGFPVALCAALDATPHTWTSQYDMGMWPGRNQYATVRVDDDGSDLALTTTVWRNTTPLAWQTVTVGGTTRVPASSPSHVLAL